MTKFIKVTTTSSYVDEEGIIQIEKENVDHKTFGKMFNAWFSKLQRMTKHCLYGYYTAPKFPFNETTVVLKVDQGTPLEELPSDLKDNINNLFIRMDSIVMKGELL